MFTHRVLIQIIAKQTGRGGPREGPHYTVFGNG